MFKAILIDDEEWCLKELSDILAVTRLAEVTGVYKNGQSAIEAVFDDRPDIAFIDIQLGDISGLDLGLLFKKNIPELHIVLMSEKEGFARKAFDIGADDFILKPFRKNRVETALIRTGSRPSRNCRTTDDGINMDALKRNAGEIRQLMDIAAAIQEL